MSAAGTLADVADLGGPAQPLLKVEGLSKHFPVKGAGLFQRKRVARAVDGVSFAIAKGETLGVVGESGCGKSTTARLLMRLIEPDAGEIVFDGERWARRWACANCAAACRWCFRIPTPR